ncbi:hypothetical protein ACOME3_007825 [Neoechinorhynchus agilis]
MKVSIKQFHNFLTYLMECSNKLGDCWHLEFGQDATDEHAIKSGTVLHDDKKYYIEHQIWYNEAYAVPILYFSITNEQGKREGVVKSLKILGLDETEVEHISEQCHIRTQKPMMVVHPCKNWNLFSGSEVSMIIKWLSVVGQHVGLVMDNRYGTLV